MLKVLNYFCKETDVYGYTHSIDNLTIVYDIEPNYQSKYLDVFVNAIHNLRDKYNGNINYWERLDVKPCSKYAWYCNHIHVDDGIYLSLGHYREGLKEKNLYVIFPLLKLEINPNKHYDKPVFKDLQEIINKYCIAGNLKKYDYTIDVPCVLADVQVFNTRKTPGLYKGTRYFGQRNKDGYVKIYNKSKESGLDYPLTRIEHTFDTVKHTQSKSFTNFYVLETLKEKDVSDDLSKNDMLILNLCARLSASGIEYEDLLQNLDKRKKRKIYNNLHGNFREVTFNVEIHDRLINAVFERFNVVIPPEEESIEEEFVKLEDGYNLPWDD